MFYNPFLANLSVHSIFFKSENLTFISKYGAKQAFSPDFGKPQIENSFFRMKAQIKF